MKWIILNPFSHNTNVRWIPEHINDENIEFKVVPADYSHDRSRENSSSKQWLDFFKTCSESMVLSRGEKKRASRLYNLFSTIAFDFGMP